VGKGKAVAKEIDEKPSNSSKAFISAEDHCTNEGCRAKWSHWSKDCRLLKGKGKDLIALNDVELRNSHSSKALISPEHQC